LEGLFPYKDQRLLALVIPGADISSGGGDRVLILQAFGVLIVMVELACAKAVLPFDLRGVVPFLFFLTSGSL